MGGKPILLKKWTHTLNVHDEMRITPLWLRFPGLPVIYWGDKTLSRLASTIGFPFLPITILLGKLEFLMCEFLLRLILPSPYLL